MNIITPLRLCTSRTSLLASRTGNDLPHTHWTIPNTLASGTALPSVFSISCNHVIPTHIRFHRDRCITLRVCCSVLICSASVLYILHCFLLSVFFIPCNYDHEIVLGSHHLACHLPCQGHSKLGLNK